MTLGVLKNAYLFILYKDLGFLVMMNIHTIFFLFNNDHKYFIFKALYAENEKCYINKDCGFC